MQKWWNWNKLELSWHVCVRLSLAVCFSGMKPRLVGVPQKRGIYVTSLDGVDD